jgi:hypothetical protein
MSSSGTWVPIDHQTMKMHGSTGIPTAKVVKCILSMSTNLCRSDVGCSRSIRDEFPSPDGNYECFKECACESDISDSD